MFDGCIFVRVNRFMTHYFAPMNGKAYIQLKERDKMLDIKVPDEFQIRRLRNLAVLIKFTSV